MLRQRRYGQYAHGPVSPALAIPNCCCGVPAVVKQSRHPKTAGRAYYICKKFDPTILLFPYENKKLVPYHEFRCWVAPPPNPPPITVDERITVVRRRRKDPLLCHCGVRATLVVPRDGNGPGRPIGSLARPIR
ncbi:hypothetical protein HU200_066537 [Digitaria exilis]|uniref:Uncharacterized protein n=1 Tax=Digitaria exilis TaxID=1010633 RepID=A0A835DWK1_9POAL|nr:hypothetical protein HU200_066537 [Digitaria exilis]